VVKTVDPFACTGVAGCLIHELGIVPLFLGPEAELGEPAAAGIIDRGVSLLGQVGVKIGIGADSYFGRLRALTSALRGLRFGGQGERVTVYQSVAENGDVEYVGITNNIVRRAAEHLASKGIRIRAIPGLTNLSRYDARSVEQALIEIHKLSKNGGTLFNKINSISRKNPQFAHRLERGYALLRNAGYVL
jgi:predicted GIY-YIG superfamily endonuclease